MERFIDPAVMGKILDVTIGEDNQACHAEVQDDRLSDFLRHVAVKYQLTMVPVRKVEVRVESVPSERMVADMITRN